MLVPATSLKLSGISLQVAQTEQESEECSQYFDFPFTAQRTGCYLYLMDLLFFFFSAEDCESSDDI